MFESVGDIVSVAGVYDKGAFHPRKFCWRSRFIAIDQITLVSNLRDGLTRKRLYSVTSGTTLYRLLFDQDNETWTLDEIWCQ